MVLVANDPAGIADLAAALAPPAPALVVLEATGGYETDLLEALWSAGIPVARVLPQRVREFARADGRLAKTDRIDAMVLARASPARCARSRRRRRPSRSSICGR
jgi:transposase